MQPLLPATKPSVDSDIVECAREVLDATPPIIWFLRRQMRTHRGGLSLAQFRSLIRVSRHPNTSLSNVAEHLGASLPTASRIMAGLVDKGLLLRHGCRWDRRQVSLELTPRGRDVLETARKATQQCMEHELSGLSRADRSTLIKGMTILKGIFGPAYEPEAVPTTSAADSGNGNSNGRTRKAAKQTALA
jgi:DNA-binding MarR family transcriptional regulator